MSRLTKYSKYYVQKNNRKTYDIIYLMKILITGASSYVGARIYFDLSKKFEIIGTYNGTKLSEKFVHLDITNEEEIKQVFNKYKPDIIIHAAAADARWCEANPEKAFLVNQETTKTIVKSADTIGAKVFYISSMHAEKPVTVYAKTKLGSEEYVKETKAGYIIVRLFHAMGMIPNTVNDRGTNRLLNNLDGKTEAAYDDSWKVQVAYLGQLSEIIAAVIERNITNETIPVGAIEHKSRYEMAVDILKPFNIKVTPVDKHDTTFGGKEDFGKLKSLQLPQYSYKTIVDKMIDEIKHRDQFSID